MARHDRHRRDVNADDVGGALSAPRDDGVYARGTHAPAERRRAERIASNPPTAGRRAAALRRDGRGGRGDGRIRLGRQRARFLVLAASREDEGRGFETPPNGTRIIAFGDAGPPLVVYANYVFADTEANRANVALGRAAPESAAWQGPLFFASMLAAFIAIFLPWFSVTFGATALALGIALYIAYENTIPRQVDIRVDLLPLFAVMLAAAISLLTAIATRKRARRRSR